MRELPSSLAFALCVALGITASACRSSVGAGPGGDDDDRDGAAGDDDDPGGDDDDDGDDGGDDDAPLPDVDAGPQPVMFESPWSDLPGPEIAFHGGAATTANGIGGAGGTVSMTADGAVLFDPAAAPPTAPTPPAADPGGAALADEDLVSDVSRFATLRISGVVDVSGTDAVRTITSVGGDIVVDGTLRAAAGQSISLQAPAGAVFVSGTVETTPAAPDGGGAAGAITISARWVVIDGKLLARGATGRDVPGGAGGAVSVSGGAGVVVGPTGVVTSAGGVALAQGGAAGSLTIAGHNAILIAGTLDAAGGDASSDAAAVGGAAGAVQLTSSGDVALLGVVLVRGGGASGGPGGATAGAGGVLRVDNEGMAALGGVLDARGAPALASGDGAAAGGVGGSIVVGETIAPSEVRVLVPIGVDGGEGALAGGDAGAITVTPRGGDLRIAGSVRLDGGRSPIAAGRGGVFTSRIGDDAGGLRVSGALRARGGSAAPGAAGAGGIAGTIDIRVLTHTGDIDIEATGEISVEGGASSGTGVAGRGGFIDLLARDGDFSLAGRIFTRGGTAPDPGGTGGNAGPLHVWTDTDHDGIGGHITIQVGGVIDVSGGPGSIGGSAVNNGRFGAERFPDGRHLIAVLLNSDSAPGRLTDGVIQNLGQVLARGAASNGDGGDVIYHGRRPGIDRDPLPGDLQVEGDGDDGQWFMQ